MQLDAQTRRQDQFCRLVAENERLLRSIAVRAIGRDRSDDALQVAYMGAWRKFRDDPDFNPDFPTAWLKRCVLNACINITTSKYNIPTVQLVDTKAQAEDNYEERHHGHVLADSHADPYDQLVTREEVLAVFEQLAALPERQREAIIMSALDGASHKEIADHFGIKENAARQLTYRARMQLTSILRPVTVATTTT